MAGTMETISKIKNRGDEVAAANRKELLTLPQIAYEISVSRRFVEMEISRHRIAATRLSSRVLRVTRTEFNRYLTSNTVPARQ
jgi:hypothetical protein